MENFDTQNPPTSFGAFKPVGNVVVVFEGASRALDAQKDLLKVVSDTAELTFVRGDEMAEMLDQMRDDQGILAVLGSELRKADELRSQAERGACFLVVYAPSDEETQDVIKVVERHDYRFALKYGHAFIERFEFSHPAEQ